MEWKQFTGFLAAVLASMIVYAGQLPASEIGGDPSLA